LRLNLVWSPPVDAGGPISHYLFEINEVAGNDEQVSFKQEQAFALGQKEVLLKWIYSKRNINKLDGREKGIGIRKG
jgi:hypothetical protein